MLRLLKLLGFDAKAKVLSTVQEAENYGARKVAEVKATVRNAAVVAALMAVGGLFALIALVVALMAAYELLLPVMGAGYALLLIAAAMALLAGIAVVVGMKRGAREPEVSYVAPVGPSPLTAAMDRSLFKESSGSSSPSTRNVLSALLADPPATGLPIDPVLRRLAKDNDRFSDETLSAAEDLIRTGSRKTVYGVLLGFAVLGWYFARQPLPPRPFGR